MSITMCHRHLHRFRDILTGAGLGLALALGAGRPASAQGPPDLFPSETPSGEELVPVRFFTDADVVHGGQSFHLVAAFDIRPGWHIYWVNPGDAGLPTEVKVTAPAGFEGAIAITPDGGDTFAGSANMANVDAMTYGYDGSCNSLYNESLPGQTQGGRFAADGDWLVVNSRTHAVIFDAVTGAARDTVSIPGETQAAVAVDGGGKAAAAASAAQLAYGACLRAYRFDRYKTKKKPDSKKPLEKLSILSEDAAGRGRHGEAAPLCGRRDLDEPVRHLDCRTGMVRYRGQADFGRRRCAALRPRPRDHPPRRQAR